jgi:hypothetical protein
MADNTKVNGLITIWKAWVFILGLMAEGMKVSIRMIKNTGLVSIYGQTKDNIKVNGLGVNNMALVFIQFLVQRLNAVFGKMERESNGSMPNKLKQSLKGK